MKLHYQTERTLVLHSPATGKLPPFLIKVLNTPNPTAAQIEQFYNEWVIGKKLDLPTVRKVIAKTQYEGKPALQLEYVDGKTLKETFFLKKEGGISKTFLSNAFIFFLKTAIQIADTLGHIHQQKIIHKDICPANILIEKETETIKIIDFGLATSLNLKTTYLGNPERIQGNLNYISPEQTGRMNRMVDYRSDLYSLGVTLYELLTDRLPFEKDDPLELVHCHLAVAPVSPMEYLSEAHHQSRIYQVISDIILKLLKKNAADRYQSAFGLKADLESCLKAVNKEINLDRFQLGLADFSEKFQIPQKLYGRTKELNTLINVYKSVSQGGTQILLISGYSGVGKSALVYEIHKPLTENRGYFIEGKFDQFQRNIPYYAWIQAFDNFVQLLLTENQIQLEKWKTSFLKALAGKGKVLTELLPSLIKIIGPQPALPELSPKENQNRFNSVFTEFIKTIAQKEHPLFIFIDDWQWTDIPSLDLLEKISLEVQVEYLLIAGAYRDNEVTAEHPFSKAKGKILEQEKKLTEIHLDNLQQIAINDLIADTLKCPMEYCQPLSQLIYSKTNGNTFFLRRMLQSLYEKKAIKLKYDARIGMQWDWDMQEIERLKISDNVVELMVEKVQELPKNTQKVLALAACIGTLFPLPILSLIYQKTEKETFEDLAIALEEGLVVPSSEHYTFSHDRIQQAVYSLIPEKEKNSFHYRIGKLLWADANKKEKEGLEENIFDIVNQLNYGLDYIKQPKEKAQLAQLNLQAGIQAKRSIAYESSLYYLRLGFSLLDKASWKKNYKLCLGLHRHLAETEAITGTSEKAIELLNNAFEHTQNLTDKVEVTEYLLWISLFQFGDMTTIEKSFQTLAECGIDFPRDEKVIEQQLPKLYQKIDHIIQERGMEYFLELEEIKGKKLSAALRILPKLAFALNHQIGRFPTYKYVIATCILTCLEHGRNVNMLPIMAHYGSILASKGKYKWANQIIQVAEQVIQIYPNFHARVQYINRSGLWCRIYGQRLSELIPFFEEGYRLGTENGNIVGATVCQYDILLHQSHQGNPIKELTKNLLQFEEYGRKIGFQPLLIYTFLERLKLTFLQTGDANDRILDSFSKDWQLAFHAPFINKGWLGHCKLAQHFWWQEYTLVLQTYQEYEPYLISCESNIIWADHFFYVALSIIKVRDTVTKEQEDYYAKVLFDYCLQIRLMSEACPDNFLHKHLLIEAEIARAEKKDWQPAQLYQQAILVAKKYEFPHVEALGNELCAKFWQELEQFTYAHIHFQQAWQGYHKWEAFALAEKLEADYPAHFNKPAIDQQKSSSSGSTLEFDLESLLKASQVLSGEIVLSNLISKMLPIVIENAGAEKVFLIAVEKQGFQLVAQAKVDEQVMFYGKRGIKTSTEFSIDVLNYVVNSLIPLVLDNGAGGDQFAHDFYMQTVQPKSVLCFPIFRKEQLSHLIYMENNLATGVFTPERLKILQSLSAQISISIENALLYEKQEKVRAAYSKFVPHPFLKVLGHESILDVKLGDQTQQEVSVLFSDIRAYTSLSETMTPSENFNFLNAYLRRIAPAIKQNNGFVSQYYGDGIMALFLNKSADALRAAVEMQRQLSAYNEERQKKDRASIKIGIGIHTGLLMLGILGEKDHQQATVVSDAVNTAARLEGLTKYYQSNIIITEAVLSGIATPANFNARYLGKVLVKGKSEVVSIYEVFDNDKPSLKKLKQSANPAFQKGLDFYFKKDFIGAVTHFKTALELYPNAPIIQRYFQKAAELITQKLPKDWTGAEVMTEK